MFSADETVSSNPFKRVFQDNTVINAATLPVVYYHAGKLTLWGNTFGPIRDTTRFIVYTRGWYPSIYEVMSLHNRYPLKDAVKINVAPNRLYSVGDVVSASISASADAFLKTMDPTPPTVRRKVFEVPAGAGSDVIQSLLSQAAALKGQRPIVHFGMGYYSVDKPLIIPAGSDMQIKGEGLLYATVLVKKVGAFGSEPMILVKGPSYVSIQDLQVGMEGYKDASACIQFEQVDQPGAQAHLDQVYSHADTSIALRELDHLYVEKDNSFFTAGNSVSGGALSRAGNGAAGLFCYGGQFEGVNVTNNGRFLSKDCWWEGDTRVPLYLTGNGTVCIDNAMIAPNRADSLTTVDIESFSGHLSLMNMYLQGAIYANSNNPGLNLLVWNIHFYFKMDPLEFLRTGANFPCAYLGLNAQCFTNSPACKDIIAIPDETRNIGDLDSFIDKETAFDRLSRPVLYHNLPAGASNVYISRVSVIGVRKNGIVFTAR
jgi:hypothetical protein